MEDNKAPTAEDKKTPMTDMEYVSKIVKVTQEYLDSNSIDGSMPRKNLRVVLAELELLKGHHISHMIKYS